VIVWPLIVTMLFGTIRPLTTSTTLTSVTASVGACEVTATLADKTSAERAGHVRALRLPIGFLMGDAARMPESDADAGLTAPVSTALDVSRRPQAG
jgi:hypothetical protein